MMAQKLLMKPESDPVPEDLLYYRQFYQDVLHTGSRVICNPPPEGTDDDWLLLTKPKMFEPLEGFLKDAGFKVGGSGLPKYNYKYAADGRTIEKVRVNLEGMLQDENFHSLKRDDLNVILTSKPEYFKRFSRATGIARSLNILEKPVRIGLFEAVFNDKCPDDFDSQQKLLQELHKKHNDKIFKNSEKRLSEKYQTVGSRTFRSSNSLYTQAQELFNPPVIADRNPDAAERAMAEMIQAQNNVILEIAQPDRNIWQVNRLPDLDNNF